MYSFGDAYHTVNTHVKRKGLPDSRVIEATNHHFHNRLSFGMRESLAKLKKIKPPMYRFYDDDMGNILRVHESNIVSKDLVIHCIHVPPKNTEPAGPVGTEDFSEDTSKMNYSDYVEKQFADSSYTEVKKMTSQKMEERKTTDGLTSTALLELQQWGNSVHAIKTTNRLELEHITPKVFFDFDLVINRVDSLALPTTKSLFRIDNITDDEKFSLFLPLAVSRWEFLYGGAEACIQYAVGSPERLEQIRNTINHLVTKGIEVHIVTNNRFCNFDRDRISHALLYLVMNKLHSSLTRDKVHCGYRYGNDKLLMLYEKGLIPRPSLRNGLGLNISHMDYSTLDVPDITVATDSDTACGAGAS